MVVLKQYIGNQLGPNGLTHYYMIQKDSLYGIELVEEKENLLTSTCEWFSEDKDDTLTFIQLLYKHGASPLHLSEMIDDYIS